MPVRPKKKPAEWSQQKRRAAHYLALGDTWEVAAKRSKSSVASICRWLREPEFCGYRDDLRDKAMARIEAKYLKTVEHSFEVIDQVLSGKAKRDDDPAIEARGIIKQFLRSTLYVPPPAPDYAGGAVIEPIAHTLTPSSSA